MPSALTPGQARFGAPVAPPTSSGIDWGNIGNGIAKTLPAIGSIAGAIIDARSNAATNRANAQQAKQAQDFTAEQSATQYQRAKADLTAAGYNPGLAYQQGGNSAGSGQQATMQAYHGGSQALAQAVDAYNAFATSSAQRQLIRAQTEQTQAQTGSIQLAQKDPKYALWFGSGEGVAKYRATEQARLLAESEAGRQRASNYPTQFTAELNNLNARTGASSAQTRMLDTQSTLNEQDFQNAWFRKNISPWINSTSKTLEPIRNFIPNMSYKIR